MVLNRIHLFLPALFFLTLSSCCTKKDCEDAINTIEFYNFSQADLNSITIYSFNKNENFVTPLDSIATSGQPKGNNEFYVYIEKFNLDQDYKIEIVSTGQIFNLSGIETNREGCNTCFPYRPKSDYYLKLKSYLVNGQKKSGPRVQINN